MNERLTIQDLTDLLAAKHDMTKKDAEAFVKEFFLLIEQALENDKMVKIKGLGTFKLVDVDSRESVKVITGERFQIKGHTKVVFSPDSSLRDTINKPFAHFEAVVLNENTVLEDTPMEEDMEEEGDENEEEMQLQETSDKSCSTETQPIVAEAKEEVQVQTEEPVSERTEEESVEQPVEPMKQPAKPEKSLIPYLIAVIAVVLIACGGAVFFIYYPDLFASSPDKETTDTTVVSETPPSAEPEIQAPDTATAAKDTIVLPKPTVDVPKQAAAPTQTNSQTVSQQPAVYLDSVSYKITGTKTKYTIKEGETLTKVSLRFYGTKAMWPYIVKHNPKVIKNPDNVPYGTTIEIPELSQE